jgi:hypothetical protein
MHTRIAGRRRRCPRCRGRLFREDYLGAEWDLVCLWCGFRRAMPAASQSRPAGIERTDGKDVGGSNAGLALAARRRQ